MYQVNSACRRKNVQVNAVNAALFLKDASTLDMIISQVTVWMDIILRSGSFHLFLFTPQLLCDVRRVGPILANKSSDIHAHTI